MAAHKRDRVQLDDVIAAAHISPREAHAIFPTTADLLAEAGQRLITSYEGFVRPALDALPNDASLESTYTAFCEGYHEFSATATVSFGAFHALLVTTELPDDFDADLRQLELNPALRDMLELVRTEITRVGGPRDVWLWTTRAIALLSSVHGLAHLNSFGVLRFLGGPAKRQLLNAVIQHNHAAMVDELATGMGYVCLPRTFLCGEEEPAIPPARAFPKTTDEEITAALFRGAIESGMELGVEDLRVEYAAQRADVNYGDTLRLLNPELTFVKQLENYMDVVALHIIGRQMAALPPDSHPVCVGKASGTGCIGLTFLDSAAFDVFVGIASGSVVPNTFEASPENHDMGAAFKNLLDLTRAAIAAGGGPRESWVLFENTITQWTLAHGLAHIGALGGLRGLDWETRMSLIDPIMNICIGSLVGRLELDIPGVSDAKQPIEQYRES